MKIGTLSAPHGAGRIMSRGQAKRELSMADFTREMSDIYSTSVSESTLDEAPMAYKTMADILDNIGDTVSVHRTHHSYLQLQGVRRVRSCEKNNPNT